MSSYRTHSQCTPFFRTPHSYPLRFHATSDPDAMPRSRAPLCGVMWPSQMQLSPPAHACRLCFSQASFRFRVHSSGGQQFSQLYSSARVSDCFDAMLSSCARDAHLCHLFSALCRAYRVVLKIALAAMTCLPATTTLHRTPKQFLS